MTGLQPIIWFGGIYNPMCVKLFQSMFGVIARNLKEERRLYLKQIFWHPQTRHNTHIHTHTHDDIIRQNAMGCVSPINAFLHLNTM